MHFLLFNKWTQKMTAYICVSIIWDGSAYLNMYLMALKQFVSTVNSRYIKFTKLIRTGHSKQCHLVALLLNLVRAIYSSLSRLQEMNCKGKRDKEFKKVRRSSSRCLLIIHEKLKLYVRARVATIAVRLVRRPL